MCRICVTAGAGQRDRDCQNRVFPRNVLLVAVLYLQLENQQWPWHRFALCMADGLLTSLWGTWQQCVPGWWKAVVIWVLAPALGLGMLPGVIPSPPLPVPGCGSCLSSGVIPALCVGIPPLRRAGNLAVKGRFPAPSASGAKYWLERKVVGSHLLPRGNLLPQCLLCPLENLISRN